MIDFIAQLEGYTLLAVAIASSLAAFAMVAFGTVLLVTFVERAVRQFYLRCEHRMHWRKLDRQRLRRYPAIKGN